jgi:cardiolipin synthase
MTALRHIPNILTAFRLGLSPYIAYCVLQRHYGAALAWGFVAGITDGIDGYLARRYHWQSKLGAILDPLADKTMMVLGYLALGIVGAVPVWLTAVVLGRDALILVAAAFAFAFTTIREFPPSFWGKLSTTIQILACAVVLCAHIWPGLAGWALTPAIYATAAVTIWSGIHYAWVFSRRLSV